jgi:hypothetical protein
MRKLLLAQLMSCLLGTAAAASPRDDAVRHWAPVIYQETNDPVKDLYAAFDFDGNWNGDDNAENMLCYSDPSKCNTPDNPHSACAGQRCPLIATVYYSVVETASHWFIQYMPYHPLDWKRTNGHEHDTESIMAVVAKRGGQYGTLELLETRFHADWYDYAFSTLVGDHAGNVDGPIHYDAKSGRPAVYSQMVGHAICGGYSPPDSLFPDLSLICNHDDEPHIWKTGVRYTPDLPAAMPQVIDGTTVDAGYTLVDLQTSIWPHIHEIGPGKAFQAPMDYQGERCVDFNCPKGFGGNWEGNEGESPGEPWAQPAGSGANAVGDQFFDPAYTMYMRLKFPDPFSLDYCYNPYLSIADTCPAVAPVDNGFGPLPAGVPGSEGLGTKVASGMLGQGCTVDARAPSSAGLGESLLVAIAVWGVGRRRRQRPNQR